MEPKYRKIAAAYEKAEHDDHHRAMVHFVEMDYQRYERFCKDKLGVSSLPFFGIWKDGKYVGGEAMGWQSVGKKLVRNIESVITARPVESPV